ncbi:hypothetical protein OPQ81_011384 [Rhizoctonia solani]|nr:hypothetical protein OPQ81_011384 [Rhizoctonia solani]
MNKDKECRLIALIKTKSTLDAKNSQRLTPYTKPWKPIEIEGNPRRGNCDLSCKYHKMLIFFVVEPSFVAWSGSATGRNIRKTRRSWWPRAS